MSFGMSSQSYRGIFFCADFFPSSIFFEFHHLFLVGSQVIVSNTETKKTTCRKEARV